MDLGPEHNIQWVCFSDEDGQCWTWQNSDVRAVKNITMHRLNVETPERAK
jgi:hypothetical protein